MSLLPIGLFTRSRDFVHRISIYIAVSWLVLIVATASGVYADTYCNGTDSTLQTDCLTGTGNVLYYDGFEDGTAVCTIADRNNPDNDGWAAKHYVPHVSCHPTNGCTPGTSFETLFPGDGCMAKSPGAAGSTYALWTGQRPSTGYEGQTPLMPDHNFNQEVTEFYHRYFIKWTPYTDLTIGNFKITTTINPLQGSQGAAGIYFGSMRANTNVGGCAAMVQNLVGGPGNLSQNQGNNAYPCANAHWWLIEEHYSHGPSGTYELWMNDCGTSGAVADCGPTQILRARHTGVAIRNTANFGNLWYEFYSSSVNGTDNQGPIEGYLDEILVTKTGPNFKTGLSDSSGTSIGTLTLARQIMAIAGIVFQAAILCGYFWQHRAAMIRASLRAYQYVLMVPYLVRLARYRRAVKRWLAQAPKQLPPPMETIEVQFRIIKQEQRR